MVWQIFLQMFRELIILIKRFATYTDFLFSNAYPKNNQQNINPHLNVIRNVREAFEWQKHNLPYVPEVPSRIGKT